MVENIDSIRRWGVACYAPSTVTICFYLTFCLLISCKSGHPVDYVDPFICTEGDHGQWLPAALIPFGLVELCPDAWPGSLIADGDFTHSGYDYSIYLTEDKILAELTATVHSGFHRYTFNGPENNKVFIYKGNSGGAIISCRQTDNNSSWSLKWETNQTVSGESDYNFNRG